MASPSVPSPLVRLEGCPTPLVGQLWPHVAPMFGRVCDRPGCDQTVEELRAACEAGNAGLLVGFDVDGRPMAAGVIQVRDYQDSGRRTWVLATGGERFASWVDVLRTLEGLARGAGSRTLEFVGRPGWRRIVPDYEATPDGAGFRFVKRLEALQ